MNYYKKIFLKINYIILILFLYFINFYGIKNGYCIAPHENKPATNFIQNNTNPHECHFWAMISNNVQSSIVEDCLVILPNSLRNLSKINDKNGWSVGYFTRDNYLPIVWRGYPPAFQDNLFLTAIDQTILANPRIIYSHVRYATWPGNLPPTGNPHPFVRLKNGKNWLMGHNGEVDRDVLLNLIRAEYLQENPPIHGSNESEWIDSELYFIYILQTLEDFNWVVKPAFGYVVENLWQHITEKQLNIFLSDGESLWGYREGWPLYYLYDETNSYAMMASLHPSELQENWIALNDNDFVTFFSDKEPLIENIEDYFGGPNILEISGFVSYYSNGKIVPNMIINLGVINQDLTDNSGFYKFGNLSYAADYIVRPSNIGNYSYQSILTYDASLAAQIAVGIFSNPTAGQRIAADVDSNGVVSTYDAALIARHAIGLPPLPSSHVGKWAYEPASFVFNSISQSSFGNNFQAILLGDVDGNWQYEDGSLNNKKADFSQNRLFDLKDIFPGDRIKIDISTKQLEKIISADIEFSFDPSVLKFKEIETTQLNQHFLFNYNDTSPGNLRIGGYGTKPVSNSGVYLTITFEVLKESEKSEIELSRYVANNGIEKTATSQINVTIESSKLVRSYGLDQNYPNPFNSETVISYRVPKSSQVKIEVFNQLGQKVCTLLDKIKPAGIHKLKWNGLNKSGDKVVSGVYYYKMRAGDYSAIKKIVYIR
ncbi:class II glutamine amidotransferase [candidate division KSB1 bacterium]|nr:class II glutamine amidotransferase [candidate division KSB1 bacterium]MBL7095050.1 class II glutamine amidotransferase [candidate division KSB1 bacterium]